MKSKLFLWFRHGLGIMLFFTLLSCGVLNSKVNRDIGQAFGFVAESRIADDKVPVAITFNKGGPSEVTYKNSSYELGQSNFEGSLSSIQDSIFNLYLFFHANYNNPNIVQKSPPYVSKTFFTKKIIEEGFVSKFNYWNKEWSARATVRQGVIIYVSFGPVDKARHQVLRFGDVFADSLVFIPKK